MNVTVLANFKSELEFEFRPSRHWSEKSIRSLSNTFVVDDDEEKASKSFRSKFIDFFLHIYPWNKPNQITEEALNLKPDKRLWKIDILEPALSLKYDLNVETKIVLKVSVEVWDLRSI